MTPEEFDAAMAEAAKRWGMSWPPVDTIRPVVRAVCLLIWSKLDSCQPTKGEAEAMTDEELEVIRLRNKSLLGFIEEQRVEYGKDAWWRDDAIGIVAANDAAALLAEVDALRADLVEFFGITKRR